MLPPATALFPLAATWLALALAPPTVTRYRIDQSLNQEIDATATGGSKEKLAFKTTSFVTVTVSDSAGGKALRVRVDSIQGDSALPVSRAVLDSARGAEFSGFLDRTGKPRGLEPARGWSAANQIQSLLADFFPWARPGLQVGESWVDTTSKTNGVGQDSVTVRRVSTYKAVRNETRASRRAVRVTQDFTSSVAGTQPTPQGPARIEGTARGTGAYYIGTDGRYLGGSWQQLSSFKISGSFTPQPLPVTIVQKTEVSTIK